MYEKQLTLFVGKEIQKYDYLKIIDFYICEYFGDDPYYYHYGGETEKNNINIKLKTIYNYLGEDLYRLVFFNLKKELKRYSTYIFFHRLYKTINNLYDLIEGNNIKQKSTINKKKYKIESITFEKINDIFKSSNHKQYEKSFLDRGFTYPFERENEGIIHRLPISYLTNKIMEIGDKYPKNCKERQKLIKDTISFITNNIESHIKTLKDIDKYDVVVEEDIGRVLKKGDRIEIKKINIKTTDSYYSEPLTSPVKVSKSPIIANEIYMKIYNNIIGGVYSYLKSNTVGDEIIKLYRKNIKGIIVDDYIFIPIKNIKFYISNRGRSTSHQRLTIRYKIKSNKNLYSLTPTKRLEKYVNESLDLNREEIYLNI